MSTFRNDTGADLYLEGPDPTPASVPTQQGEWFTPKTYVVKRGATVELSNFFKKYTVAGGADKLHALTLLVDDGIPYATGQVGTPLGVILSKNVSVTDDATPYVTNLYDLSAELGSPARYLVVENTSADADDAVVVRINGTTDYTVQSGASITLERDTLLVETVAFATVSAGSGGTASTLQLLYGT